ncbi:MAG: AzlD domain-containing protein [Pseudomonadota bacterium]
MNTDALLMIAAMAVITFGCRAGGLWLAQRLPQSGPIATTLHAIPALVLMAVIVPGIINFGWIGVIVAAIVFEVSRKTGSILMPILVGIGLIAGARFVGLLP